MKRIAIPLALLLALAAAVGLAAYRASGDAPVREALAKQDALAWLKADFELTDAQFAAIKRLHDAYSVECEAHCNAIQVAARARAELRRSGAADAAALQAADARYEQLRQECESAIATHVRRCAAEMSPDAGARYLALVLPKIRDFDHQAAPDVRMESHRH